MTRRNPGRTGRPAFATDDGVERRTFTPTGFPLGWGSETGTLGDEFPYARAGTAEQPLVVLPGIGDALFPGYYPPPVAWVLGSYFSRFLDSHTVYLVSRPRGLPSGHTIEGMADNVAPVLAEEFGSADVLGISMGGLIGQALGFRHPDLVDRLVLANTGYHPSQSALEDVERFHSWVQERNWARIRAELATAMFSDLRQVFYPPLVLTAGRFLQPRPADPGDVTVSLSAIQAFHDIDRLDAITAPTLVFGGSEDPYYPTAILEETAESIPDARLAIVEGAKHAAFHERKCQFDAAVEEFFEDTESRC